MIEIRPDPKHPLGGFAEITIAGAAADGDPVMVSVFNSYQQKWLSPEGWQANKTSIAARETAQEGDTLRLIVGPDIVNQIEEDTPIRIEIGGNGWDTYWPDDINIGPDEAIIGGIGGTGAAPETKAPTVMTAQPEAETQASVLSAADAVDLDEADLSDDADEHEAEEDTGGKSKTGIFAAIAVLALLLAGGAYYYFSQNSEPVETAVVTPEPEPVPAPPPAPESDACAVDQIAALSSEGFGSVANKIRECGGSLTPDNALGFVEKAANDGDADALALFGSLYDNAVTDDVIEGQIGLTFADDPARAAEYYSRAAQAGSVDADTRLKAVCLRLRLKSDTLSQSALEDYCQ